MTKVSNCGMSETGGITGRAGDQTGNEYCIRSWSDFGQDCVLWHPSSSINSLVADLACEAAANNKIGYDQTQRETFWEQVKKVRYRPADVKKACEADCSSSTATIVKCAGYITGDAKLKAVPVSCWTGNLKAALVKAGYEVHTEAKYTRSPDYLPRGSINLNQAKHVNINVTNGGKHGTGAGRYKAKTKIVLREGDTMLFKPVTTLKKGTVFEVTLISDRGWGYVPKYDAWGDLSKAQAL